MALVINPATGRKVYVLRRKSDGAILKRFVAYPGAVDDAPLPGLDANLEFLAIDRDPQPAVDGNYRFAVAQESKQGSIWKIAWTTQKRATEALIRTATAIAEREFVKHFPTGDSTTFTFLCAGALDKARRGTALLAGETARLNALQTRYAKILANAQNLSTLVTAIQGGSEPDMNSGWATP